MADLAGFDVIGQIHLETIVDLINLSSVTNPVDGKSIYLLGGPVSIELSVDLGPLGVIAVRAILDATLQAVIHQPLARFVISLTGSSSPTVAGRTLSHISGQVTISIPLAFQVSSGVPTPPVISAGTPVFLFGVGSPSCVLNGTTRGMADAVLGSGGADRLTAALCTAVAAYLASFGTMSIPALAFRVIPGIESSDPTQLSSTPIVAWIDSSTLGVFGYYRAAASGGDVSRKTTGDLGQSHEEFFYNQPGVVSVLPGRRTAILLSADAFEQVLACPTIRNVVVRSILQERDRLKWIAIINTRDRATLLQQLMDANFTKYFYEEVSNNTGNDLQAIVNKANARVNADVDAAIINRARMELDSWLNGSEGQKAITAALPEPCGQGLAEIDRKHVPFAQSDLVPLLRRLEVRLGDARITVHYHVDGVLETNLGDVSFQVSGDMDIFLTVTDLDVFSSFALHPPVVNVSASGLAGTVFDFLKGYFGAARWSGIMAFVSLVLQTKMNEGLNKRFPLGQPPRDVPVPLPQQPFPTRLVNIKIDSGSLLVLGLVCRRQHWNEFNPALLVDATVDKRVPADEPAVHGKIRLQATEWGCAAAEFDTTRTFWDTTMRVRARLRDAPLPITVVGWHVELGNFSVTTIGGAHLLDPRPTWSLAPVDLAAGRLILTGNVNHPDPPLVLIAGPSALGHLRLRNDVPVDVTGDRDTGWKLSFHGVDGNFYVLFSVEVRDGDGNEWHGETFVTVQGDQLEMPAGYAQYQADCDAKYKAWFRLKMAAMGRLAILAQVAPGQPVMTGEAREAIAIRTLVGAGDPFALGHLLAAAERFGPSVFQQVGHVAPTPLAPQGEGQQLR